MLHIDIVCIGKIKEKFFKEAIEEYSKRLSKYCILNIIELPDEKLPSKLNDSLINVISSKIKKDSYIFALDLKGNTYSSEKFSEKIENLSIHTSNITFLIGGTLGMTKELINSCNESICFSNMTFPHPLIRVFLLEQLFRAFKISRGENYHH